MLRPVQERGVITRLLHSSHAQMVESVDTSSSEGDASGRAGSTPALGTMHLKVMWTITRFLPEMQWVRGPPGVLTGWSQTVRRSAGGRETSRFDSCHPDSPGTSRGVRRHVWGVEALSSTLRYPTVGEWANWQSRRPLKPEILQVRCLPRQPTGCSEPVSRCVRDAERASSILASQTTVP